MPVFEVDYGQKATCAIAAERHYQNAFRLDRHCNRSQVSFLLQQRDSEHFLQRLVNAIDRLVEASQPETARLWVAYSCGLEAPLEPQLSAGQLSELGQCLAHADCLICLIQ